MQHTCFMMHHYILVYMIPFCNTNVLIMTWDKCGDSCFTHYTTHFAPNYKTIFFTEWGNCTHWYMLQPITLSTIRTIASMRLSSHALGHRWWVFDYARFAQNKFEIMSITLRYNALPMIIFDDAFHTSSTKPNPCMNLSHNHNVHSRLQHSSVKFLNIESRHSLSHVSREM